MRLSVEGISKSYSRSGFWRRDEKLVLDEVSFELVQGESVGLVGGSGSGKSTLARIVSGIERPSHGDVRLNGDSLFRRQHRRNRISVVFQDYSTSINPAMQVFDVIAEPLLLAGFMPRPLLQETIAGLLAKVGLSADLMSRYLAELSGGQAQRVCICRAIATQPDFIVLDEAISSLDLPVQVQVLDLLEKLRDEFGLSYLFITHDIQALCYFCQRVLFFMDGRIVEQCALQDLAAVQHPYARQLLQAVI